MNDKIQELTDKLYTQGLSKGKAEGERLIEEARTKAAEIIADAQKEAEKIIADAHETSLQLKSKTESDVRMAAEQAVLCTRQAIENLINFKICEEPLAEAMKDPVFLKTVISKVAEGFSSQECRDMEIILPENMRDTLAEWVKDELALTLSSGVSASFSSKIKGGFNIAPKDGGWFISFSDDAMRNLIGEYIRPITRKLLFGE